MKKLFGIFIGLTLSFQVYAVDHSGKVKEIRYFSNNWTSYSTEQIGYAAIYFDPGLPKACGTGDTRVIIGSNHPLFDVVVSTALAAKVSEADVMVNYLDTCNVRSNSWDFGTFRIE